MHAPDQFNATQLLEAAARGDRSRAARLLPLVYDQLRSLAAGALRRERPAHTLQPTALVHEAFLRLIDQTHANYSNKAHFVAVAAEMIRRVLVDHARMRHAAKRGGDRIRITLDERVEPHAERDLDLLTLDEALERLKELNEREARVVELRFFGGLSVEETAEVLQVSPRTVEQDWRMARAWLRQELMKGVEA